MGQSCSHIGGTIALQSKDAIRDSFQARYGRPRPDVEHVVVLMLENRTFDSLLGVWMDRRMARNEVKPSRWDTHALTGKRLYDYKNIVVPHGYDDDESEEEEVVGVEFPVWSKDPRENILSFESLSVPQGHPAEKYNLLNLCVFEDEDPAEDSEITLGGFAQQYYEREMHDLEELGECWGDRTDFEKRRSPAMHVYLPEQANIFTRIGESFGVSDTYFSSAPCQTWPNRLFASSGHCYGYVNNLSDYGEAYDHDKMTKSETMARVSQFSEETIFNRLLSHGVEWSIYGGDYPLSIMLNRRLHGISEMSRVYAYRDFLSHARDGRLPPFTWVEPQFLDGVDGSLPTDMHPPHSIDLAQNLIADMYNAMRSDEEAWRKTVFLVTCDEGVGVFDHVPPPKAKRPKKVYPHKHYGQSPPFMMKSDPFARYGTRVPCLLATPLLQPGSVVRPDSAFSEYPFCHASILRTVFDLFIGPDCHLTERDKAAPSFAPYLLPRARDEPGPAILQKRPLPQQVQQRGRLGLTAVTKTLEASSKALEDATEQVRGGCHSMAHLLDFTTDDAAWLYDGSAQEAYASIVNALGKDTLLDGASSHVSRQAGMWGLGGFIVAESETDSDECIDECGPPSGEGSER